MTILRSKNIHGTAILLATTLVNVRLGKILRNALKGGKKTSENLFN